MRAKAIMQYNLATAHAIRGEYDKAVQNLGEVGCIVSSNVNKEYSAIRH